MHTRDQADHEPESDPRTARRAVLRRVRTVASGLLVLWGIGWAGFAVATASGPDASPAMGFAAVAVLAAFVGAAVRFPRQGGIALILGGLFALERFDHPFARLALAAPAVVLGVVHVLVGVMRPAGES